MIGNFLKKIFIKAVPFDFFIEKFGDMLPIGILIHTNGIIKYINKTLLELSEAKDKNDIIGKSIFIFFDKNSLPEVRNRIDLMKKNKKAVPPIIEKIITFNGNKLFLEVVAMPIKYSGEEAFLVLFRDLTDTFKLNRELEKNQKEKTLILDSIDEIILETDSFGKIIDFKNNPANGQEIISHLRKFQNFLDAINPEESDNMILFLIKDENYNLIERPITVSFNCEPRIACEIKLKKIDKDKIYLFIKDISTKKTVENRLKELLEENKNKNEELIAQNLELKKTRAALISLVEDLEKEIQEKNLYQDNLKKSETKYREIFDNINEGIFIHDAKTGEVLDINKAVLIMYGYEVKEEVLKKSISDLSADIYPYDQKTILEKIQSVSATGQEKFEWLAKKKNGELFWVEVVLIYSCIAGENRVISVVRDLTEWKNTIKALKESQEIFEKVANTSAALIFVYQDVKFVFVNDLCCQALEMSREEIMQMNFWEMVHPKYQEIIKMRGFERLKGKEVVKRYEFPIITKSGKIKWLDYSADLINWKGRPAGIGVAIDITEKKRNELILQIQSTIFHAVLTSKNLKELFYECRKEMGKLVNISNFYVAFYDKKKHEFYSPYNEDMYDDIERWHAEGSMSYQVIKKERAILIKEEQIEDLLKKGEIRLIGEKAKIWMGAPLIVKGEVVGVFAIQDYEDKHAYDDLSLEIMKIFADNLSLYIEKTKYDEQIRLLSEAIEQSPNIIIITDLEGNIIYANSILKKITYYDISEVIGQNFQMLESGFNSEEFYEKIWKKVLSGEIWRGELYSKKKNGEFYWESVAIAPIKDSEGKLFRVVIVKQDVTELKKLIAELTEAKEKAEEINRLKTQFFAYMSHELRTPFLGIMGYAQLLRELSESEEAVDMAEGILRSSQRMIDTLSNILDLTKLEFDKTEAVIKETNIVDIVDDVYKQFEKTALQKNIELKKKVSFSKLIIKTDERFILGILSNLVNNAIKFTLKGYVLIEIDYVQGNCQIKVADSGIGIPKDKLDVIFEEFRQVSEGTARDFQGSGLGLTIVKKYAQLLKGNIKVESEVNTGTIFTVTFPAEAVEIEKY